MRHRLVSKTWRLGSLRPVLLGVTLFVTVGHIVSAAENTGGTIAKEVQAVFEKCRDAVVKIEAVDEHGTLAGTGFFVDPNGTLYTSYTIGGETHDITVLLRGEKIRAERLLADSRSGIAILKIDRQTPFVQLGKSSGLAAASPVMVIGYPMDLPLTPALGLVGGLEVKYLGKFFSTAHIRASVLVQPGEGGAPLLNLDGEAVGILISRLENSSGGFALPIEAAEKVRKEFLRFGELRPGWIGITVADVEKDGGVQVKEMVGDAPAAKAGMQKGDMLMQVGATKIKSTDDVLNASFYITAGDEVPVTVQRNGEILILKVAPATPPSSKRETVTLAPLSPGEEVSLKPGK